jgi:hypothetical protein
MNKIQTGKIITGKPSTMSAREAAGGLNLAGNNTIAGRNKAALEIPPPVRGQEPIELVSTRNNASGAAGDSLSGIEIIWADQEETFISASDILENYDSDNDDYWSVVFAVSNNAFTQATPTYDSTQDLWDDTGTDQTVYRLRVKTLDGDNDPTSISMYGQYRESILCVNGDPVTVLVKIS